MGVLLIVFMVAVATGWAISALSNRGRARVTEPQCAACGYCVRGISSWTCPECGADLREAGILTAGMQLPRRPLGMLERVLAWSLLLPVAAVVASTMVLPILPQYLDQLRRAYIHCPWTLHAETRGSRLVAARLYSPNTQIPVRTVTLTFDGRSQMAPIEIDLAEQSYEFVDSQAKLVRKKGFGPAALLEWLGSTGVDTSKPRMPEIAEHLAAAVTLLAQSPPQRSRHVLAHNAKGEPLVELDIADHSTSLRHVPWVIGLYVSLWVMLWLAGLWFIVREQRRQNPGTTRLPRPAQASCGEGGGTPLS